jgi:O-antigen/teichoic acid export membrane protein
MIFFPLFFGLSMLAEPFVRIFLTDTWIAAVPVIRILSIAFLFYPLININMYVFQIKGLSGRFLSIEVLTKISGIIILIVTLQYDMVVVSVGILVQQVIHLLVSAYYADKLLKKRPFAQFGLLLPLFVFSIVISLLNNYVMEMISDVWLKFFSGFLIILVSYGFYYLVFNKDEMKMLVGVFRKKGSV